MRFSLSLLAVVVVTSTSCDAPVDSGEGEGEGEGEGGEGEGEGEGEEGEGEGEPVTARFVAVGYGARRLTSVDGEVWDNDIAAVQNGGDDDTLLRGACVGEVAGQTIVLAVGGSVRGVVRRSVDGGVSWTTSVDDDRGWIGACAFNADGTAVFVGSARSSRSLDGGLSLVDHAVRFFPGGGWGMRDVIAAPAAFVAVGDLGVSTSVDGVTWSDPSGPARLARIAHGVVAGADRFVAVGFAVRATSGDLSAWSEAALSNGGDVVFADQRFLIVGDGYRQTSTDGVAFVPANQPAMSRVVAGVVNGRTRYVGANFPDVRRVSDDGLTWRDAAPDDGAIDDNAIDDLVFVPGP